MTLSWERTRRNRTHTTESTHTTKSSYSREPSYSRGYSVHGHGNLLLFWFERQCNFPHLAQFTSFSPMTTSPRAVDEENTTAYSVKKYYLRTMDSQVLTGGWTRALGHDRTWQEKRRAWQGSQNLIFTIRGQSFFPRFPELFSHGIWSAWSMGKISLEPYINHI